MSIIKYTTKINSTDSDVKNVSSDKYEEICKKVARQTSHAKQKEV